MRPGYAGRRIPSQVTVNTQGAAALHRRKTERAVTDRPPPRVTEGGYAVVDPRRRSASATVRRADSTIATSRKVPSSSTTVPTPSAAAVATREMTSRARATSSGVGVKAGLDRGELRGMDGRPADEAQRPPRRAAGGQAVEIGDVGVDAHHRRRDPGGRGGVDDPRARPEQSRFAGGAAREPELRSQVRFAEPDRRDSRRRDLERALDPQRRLDERVDRAGAEPFGERDDLVRRLDLRNAHADLGRQRRDRLEVGFVPGGPPRVDAHLERRRP